MTYTRPISRTKNESLKKMTLKEIDALTERQAKGALAFISGYYIENHPDEWKWVWEHALKNVEGMKE
jgi:hypothetical protein